MVFGHFSTARIGFFVKVRPTLLWVGAGAVVHKKKLRSNRIVLISSVISFDLDSLGHRLKHAGRLLTLAIVAKGGRFGGTQRPAITYFPPLGEKNLSLLLMLEFLQWNLYSEICLL
ncbi:hypothetical protein CH352_15100 [Leptospira hartskeerlii]|uniref:Uncharacterized protein n=1 Tax=Leptospira hartskeerlii TaxID=2023177 RepID=A0A2M9XCH0_9LEPT|nr:hypothetical protein CH357_10585 [Leptospira hartskeerlii]PJZ32656.1 hypothetical protein CH352_15100 [Leptospira hartskeerlii]